MKTKTMLCLVLAIILLTVTCVPAFAESGTVTAIDEVGLTITWPEGFSIPGMSLVLVPGGEQSIAAEDLQVLDIVLLKQSGRDADKPAFIVKDNQLDFDWNNYISCPVGSILVTSMELQDAVDLYNSLQVLGFPYTVSESVVLESDGEQNCYFVVWNVFPYQFDKEIWDGIRKELLEVLPGTVEMREPDNPMARAIGKTMAFETTDLDGNQISISELFAQNEITLVNMWGVWCPPCVEELKDLGELHTRLQELGCGIVGIEAEQRNDAFVFQYAKQQLASAGASYPNVLFPGGVLPENPDDATDEQNLFLSISTTFPTTFYVDRNGTILAYPTVGANPEALEANAMKLLEQAKGHD